MAKDEINGEEVDQATKLLSVSSVANMTTMQMSATEISVLVVVKSNTMQGTVDPKTKGKRRPTFS